MAGSMESGMATCPWPNVLYLPNTKASALYILWIPFVAYHTALHIRHALLDLVGRASQVNP